MQIWDSEIIINSIKLTETASVENIISVEQVKTYDSA